MFLVANFVCWSNKDKISRTRIYAEHFEFCCFILNKKSSAQNINTHYIFDSLLEERSSEFAYNCTATIVMRKKLTLPCGKQGAKWST